MLTENFFLAVDGTPIAYSVTPPTAATATRPAMVLCSGLGCDQYEWKYLVDYFRADHRIYQWNYRGHGHSGAPTDPSRVTIADTVSDLAQLIAQEGLRWPILVGHSMGVQVILHYTLHAKERPSALVPICGGFGRPLSTFHNTNLGEKILPILEQAVAKAPRLSRFLWRAANQSPLAFAVAARLELNRDFIKKEDFQPYFDHLATLDLGLFLRMLSALNAEDLEAELGHIKIPTLIVAGERDTFTPAWLSLKMQRLIVGSELLLVRGGSHTALIEFPELVHLRIEKFLRERVALSDPVS